MRHGATEQSSIDVHQLRVYSLSNTRILPVQRVRSLSVPKRTCAYGIVAGDENGLVASTTNMTRAARSPLPLLDTSIGVPGGWPSID
jgi:hypothetical protein